MEGDVDGFLAHYGVKGMKWGVRKDRKSSGGRSSSKDEKTSVDQAASALHSFAVNSGIDSASLESKYGPSSTKEEPALDDEGSFYQRHKTAINIGVGVAAAGLVAYGGYKYHQNLVDKKNQASIDALIEAQIKRDADRNARADLERHRARLAGIQNGNGGDPELARIRQQSLARKGLLSNYADTSNRKFAAGFDPDALDRDPINISKGTIFKRVSTEKETDLKSTGFFASYTDEDVERYKAILPTFWPKWGINKDSGYIVNIKANSDVKAPSPRKAYEMYRDLMDEPSFRNSLDPQGLHRSKDSETFARETFTQMTLAWNTPSLPPVKAYMAKVKESGYNALLDQNDAGLLSKKPMLLLDTNMFNIEGYDTLSAKDIGDTQIKEAKKLGLV